MIVTLGPKGTFSHRAALNVGKNICFENTLWEVFEAVATGRARKGVVPIENSLSGTIGVTYDCLIDSGLSITGELFVPVHHFLVGVKKVPLSLVRTLYVQSDTLSQCIRFIRSHLPSASLERTSSNAESAKKLVEDGLSSSAAITSDAALHLHQLAVLCKDVQDSPHNVTRFIIVEKRAGSPRGRAKTSIALHPKLDRAGLLYHILGVFAQRSINLTKIESRPARGKYGDYIFFIDMEGSLQQAQITEALKQLKAEKVEVFVFGSYSIAPLL